MSDPMTREDPVRAARMESLLAFADRIEAGETPNDAAGLEWMGLVDDIRALAASPADGAGPQSVFYDGAHDDCPYDYRHNHSTAPLRDALTLGEHALVDAVLRAASPADGAGVDVERLRRQAALDARVRDAALDIEPSSPEPQWTEFRTLRNRAARAALEGASDGTREGADSVTTGKPTWRNDPT